MRRDIAGRWITLISIIFLSIIMVTDTYAEEDFAMPNVISNVHLGMDADELLEVRPNIKKDDFPGSALYFESNIGDVFFTTVVYKITKISNSLFSVNLTFETRDIAIFRQKLQGIILGCIRKWGNDFKVEIKVREDEATGQIFEYPELAWKNNINLKYFAYEGREKIYAVELNIDEVSIIDRLGGVLSDGTSDSRKLEDLYLLEDIDNYKGSVFE